MITTLEVKIAVGREKRSCHCILAYDGQGTLNRIPKLTDSQVVVGLSLGPCGHISKIQRAKINSIIAWRTEFGLVYVMLGFGLGYLSPYPDIDSWLATRGMQLRLPTSA